MHSTESCPKYLHTVAIARKHGRTVHPPEWTMTGAAYAAGKGICSGCWTG